MQISNAGATLGGAIFKIVYLPLDSSDLDKNDPIQRALADIKIYTTDSRTVKSVELIEIEGTPMIQVNGDKKLQFPVGALADGGRNGDGRIETKRNQNGNDPDWYGDPEVALTTCNTLNKTNLLRVTAATDSLKIVATTIADAIEANNALLAEYV